MIYDGQIVEVVHALQQAGAAVALQLPSAYGAGPILQLTAAEAEELIARPRIFIASRLGVNTLQLAAWEENDHVPKCGAKNKDWSMCGNSVSPNRMVEPAEFAATHRIARCHVHA